MATEKWVARLEAKLDALLQERGIDMAQFDESAGATRGAPTTRQARALTPQEQQAINNAPKAEATVPPEQRGPRVTAQNAPDTSSRVPADAVGQVTVETEQPDGETTVETKRATSGTGEARARK